MEFDKNKVLTVVTADQLKEGQTGWINDYVDYLESDVKSINPYKVFRTNKDSTDFPFTAGGRGIRRYFYPEQALTYEERQAEWIKANNVKVGTKVRFIKGFNKSEDGSHCCEHRDVKGKEGVVIGIPYEVIYVEMGPFDIWACPFTAIEVIKEPTYRPYDNDELNELVGEVLTNKQSGRRKLVTGKPTSAEGVNLDGSYINAKDLLYSFYRNRDEPCGVKE